MTGIDDELVTYARAMHERAPEAARLQLGRPNAMVFRASCDDDGMPVRIVVVRVADGSLAYDATVDERSDGVLAELDGLVRTEQLIWTHRTGFVETKGIALIEWDRASGMDAATRLLNHDGSRVTPRQAGSYPWLQLAWPSAGGTLASWFAEPLPTGDLERKRAAQQKTDGPVGKWIGSRLEGWLKKRTAFAPDRYEPRRQPLPGATGDPVADARRIIQVLHDVAAGTAPVSPAAPFA